MSFTESGKPVLLTDGQMRPEMRVWCADCFSDMPDDATDAEIEACVARQYDGGLAGFLADCH